MHRYSLSILGSGMSNPVHVLSGRYELYKKLARGGMAEVFLARDRQLDRPVAVKILFPEFATDPAFVERFRREAKAAANLNHPNIVGVYDWGEEGGTYFIVMEYIDGPSLNQILKKNGNLASRKAAEIASDVADALGFAHGLGVVHRDIKPANIMLTNRGTAKVADFGIARVLQSPSNELTKVGSVMGTATYFSPEQAQGHDLDGRSDLYSLGTVLYEMITGRPPFKGDTPVAIAYKHVQERPPRPATFEPGLPFSIEAVTLKLLTKDRNLRYADAAALKADLQSFCRGEVTEAEQALPAAKPPSSVPAEAPATAMSDISPTQVQERHSDQGGPAEPLGKPLGAVGQESGMSKRTKRYLIVLAVLLTVLVGLLVFVSSMLGADDGDGASENEVEIPSVVGQQEKAAIDELEGLGLTVATSEKFSSKTEGTVLSQDPASGEKAEKGDKVDLVISGGKRLRTIPNVVDSLEEDARAELAEDGFEMIETESRQDADAAPGTVLEQSPPGGEEADIQDVVKLVVATEPVPIEIPDVTGESGEEAKRLLEERGFRIGEIGNQPNDDVPRGHVISVSPTGVAEAGTTISLLLSNGPATAIVPSVVGLSQTEAEAALSEAGFTSQIQTFEVPVGDSRIGKVAEVTPSAGSRPEVGATVVLRVAVQESAPATTSSPSSSAPKRSTTSTTEKSTSTTTKTTKKTTTTTEKSTTTAE